MSAGAHKGCCSGLISGAGPVLWTSASGSLSISPCVRSFQGAPLVKSDMVPGVHAKLTWTVGV